ncbi:Orf13 [Pseudomonas amygdali pv. photiniae]|uniref:Orf13 n=1 Tax=Pseudomonas amygdali pv. photiniae TaxID=251724 RepID=A0A0N8RY47_PSEA0|nr:Orf13 [Pseudomonas amygdali pv. photiniae]
MSAVAPVQVRQDQVSAVAESDLPRCRALDVGDTTSQQIAKPRSTLMAWLKDECSHGRPEHCNAITATLLFELTVDLCSWNNHFGDVRGHTVDGVTTVLEEPVR